LAAGLRRALCGTDRAGSQANPGTVIPGKIRPGAAPDVFGAVPDNRLGLALVLPNEG
jgi:hypothetical protein